ncbi:MAG: 3-keto-5-aminohexanoate cleavage protein [Solirubrobacterales bacterium]
MSEGEVIITAALTGGVHDKSYNENLPEQPDEVIEAALAAREAGAAIVHCHARMPDGARTCDPEIFKEIHDGITAKSDLIVQLTTGGGLGLSVEERMGAIWLEPEMASLNMGLMNFIFQGKEHYFANMRSDIENFAKEMKDRGIRPECEVYNISMIDEVEHLINEGLLEAPYVINFVLDTPSQGGLAGTADNLVEMTRRVRERFDIDDVRINVTSCGTTQNPMSATAMAMGQNIRVGMEDCIFYRRKELVQDNAQLVARAARIAKELNLEPTTPDRARELLAIG